MSTPDSKAAPAGSRTARYVLFLGLAAVGCAADLISKAAVFDWLGAPSPERSNIHWLVEGWLAIETALNQGALFGLGQGKVWVFALLSVVALGGIGYWVAAKKAIDDVLLTVTLGLVTGGILGNLYDRLGLWSDFRVFAVRDWIRLSYGRYVWPNFNIADSLLVCGAALLVWHSLRTPNAEFSRA